MDDNKGPPPLHLCHVDTLGTAINRAHLLLHSSLLSLFIYHRLHDIVSSTHLHIHQLLLLLAELILSFVWLSDQATRWRLVYRAVFVDRLPADETLLPALDVFICTADPDKEPTVGVMNTVVSSMALDYPGAKLNVYLSDDGGAEVTLGAMKEAWGFATWWVPFCRKYKVECRSPMAYFGDEGNQQGSSTDHDFVKHRAIIKEKYEVFKERVEIGLLQMRTTGIDDKKSRTNHPPLVQVIDENCVDGSIVNPDNSDMPLLVYVAREKRTSHPHHFKAGALNVLLRVSGMLSNSPIVLVLDCDMYCNDPTSAKQAMCFFLDKNISPSLGFVQFPQRFHNLSKHDIYDMEFRWANKGLFRGMDGLGTGPSICGTGFYVNRKALYSGCVKGLDPVELRSVFGPSNEFIRTLSQDTTPKEAKIRETAQEVLHEAGFVASCSYEKETKWGDGLGFYYYSVAEDIFTGYHLHIRGWKSVFLDPQRASFLGSSTTNLNDMLVQNARWTAGMVEVGLSRFCPLVYGPSRRHLSLLHRTCYAWIDMYALSFISFWCWAIIPPLCLLNGIHIFPKASRPTLFPLLGLFIFLSSLFKHLQEVLTTGGTISSWWNEQRTWILKMLTCHTYGCIDAIMKILGIKKTSFVPTNKVVDEDQEKMYRQGMYDFQTSTLFLVPLGTVVILNVACFVVGSVRMMVVGNWDEMAVQVVLSGFFILLSAPVVEGMVVRKDRGRFPASATTKCVVVCLLLILFSPFILLH